MNNPCILFHSQSKKAKETLEKLEKQRDQIDFELKSNPICSDLHKKLRMVNLDIKITTNELEHAEYSIKNCELKYNFSETDSV